MKHSVNIHYLLWKCYTKKRKYSHVLVNFKGIAFLKYYLHRETKFYVNLQMWPYHTYQTCGKRKFPFLLLLGTLFPSLSTASPMLKRSSIYHFIFFFTTRHKNVYTSKLILSPPPRELDFFFPSSLSHSTIPLGNPPKSLGT